MHADLHANRAALELRWTVCCVGCALSVLLGADHHGVWRSVGPGATFVGRFRNSLASVTARTEFEGVGSGPMDKKSAPTKKATTHPEQLLQAAAARPGVAEALAVFQEASKRAPMVVAQAPKVRYSTHTNG